MSIDEAKPDGYSSGDPLVFSDTSPHVLIVDDDSRIRMLLHRYLHQNGIRVTTAESASDARCYLNGLAFDLLIVDVMMPGEDGVSFTSSLREVSDVPILMLTAKVDADHRITGLEAGADDYLPKPFEPRELLLRINNILKRQSNRQDPLVEFVKFGTFTFHLAKGSLAQNGKVIKLTDREKDMMRAFCEVPGAVVPRHSLLSDPTSAGERTVDVQINRLRRKIEIDPTNPVYLHTVRGVGYRLSCD